MVQFKSEKGYTEGICSGTAIEITSDCLAIAMSLYNSLLETNELAARAYIGILKAFVNDPDRLFAEYIEEE